jgi:hypothetical protein
MPHPDILIPPLNERRLFKSRRKSRGEGLWRIPAANPPARNYLVAFAERLQFSR